MTDNARAQQAHIIFRKFAVHINNSFEIAVQKLIVYGVITEILRPKTVQHAWKNVKRMNPNGSRFSDANIWVGFFWFTINQSSIPPCMQHGFIQFVFN